MKIDEWHDGCQIIINVSELREWFEKSGAFRDFEKQKENAKSQKLRICRVLFPKIPNNFFGVPTVEVK